MSDQDTTDQTDDPRDSGGPDPRQGVHGGAGYGDPSDDGETTSEDAPPPDESPAEQEPGQIGGA